ncbi:MAG: methyltransferase domain-containing protein [Promethearchaeota archaeon]|nr:MAG: SAM-dependent methyltransferase [Helarchaeota virus Nidhogg Meg22_1012]URC17340.1 MAG: SAM-dependent methyltransferase [Helarchaeota virus Nidhogg Meg22_1214]
MLNKMVEKYSLVLDNETLSKYKYTSDLAREWVLHPETFKERGIGYPMDNLVESIKNNGFMPDRIDVSLHNDVFPGKLLGHPLVIKENFIPLGIHRIVAARLARLKKIPVYREVVLNYDDEQKKRIKNVLDNMKEPSNIRGKKDLFQTWNFSDEYQWCGRDDCESILKGFKVGYIATGKTVLDIACNTGWYSIVYALQGAKEVVGFDLIPYLIKLARDFADIYPLKNCRFDVCEFWDYPFDKKYDIVMCNQAIYHFLTKHRSKCLGNKDDVLERISRVTNELFMMYTYVDAKYPHPEGYYPDSKTLTDDLKRHGFKEVMIFGNGDPHKHVLALK